MSHIHLVEAEHLQAEPYEPASVQEVCVQCAAELARFWTIMAASVLAWAVLVFAFIGVVAVFGRRA